MALESRVTQANATALFTTTESRVTQLSASILFGPSIPNSHVTQLSISPLFHEIDTRLTQLSVSALTQAAAVLKRHFTRIPRIRI
jgi:hypothetical protein